MEHLENSAWECTLLYGKLAWPISLGWCRRKEGPQEKQLFLLAHGKPSWLLDERTDIWTNVWTRSWEWEVALFSWIHFSHLKKLWDWIRGSLSIWGLNSNSVLSYNPIHCLGAELNFKGWVWVVMASLTSQLPGDNCCWWFFCSSSASG